MAKNERGVQWVFDLDDTLYGPADNLKKAIAPKIEQVILEHTRLPRKDYEAERQRLRHETEPKTNDTLLAFATAYNLPYEKMVKATYLSVPLTKAGINLRPGVRDIANLPGEKIVLSNAPRLFVNAVLTHFGIDDLFSEIIASEPGRYIHKPDVSAFKLVRPETRTIIIENEPKNLEWPSKLGWTTVWFPDKEGPKDEPWVDRIIHSASELGKMVDF